MYKANELYFTIDSYPRGILDHIYLFIYFGLHLKITCIGDTALK